MAEIRDFLKIVLKEEHKEYMSAPEWKTDEIKTHYYIWKVIDKIDGKELGVIDYAPKKSVGDKEIKIKGYFSPDEVIELMNLVKESIEHINKKES